MSDPHAKRTSPFLSRRLMRYTGNGGRALDRFEQRNVQRILDRHRSELIAWWEEEGRPEVLVEVQHVPAYESGPFYLPEVWRVCEHRVEDGEVTTTQYDPYAGGGLDYYLRNYSGDEPREP